MTLFPCRIEVTGIQDEITPGTIGIGDKCADHTPKGSPGSVLMYNELMPQQGADLSRFMRKEKFNICEQQ